MDDEPAAREAGELVAQRDSTLEGVELTDALVELGPSVPGVWSGRGVVPVAMTSWSKGSSRPPSRWTVLASASTRSTSAMTTVRSGERNCRELRRICCGVFIPNGMNRYPGW